VARPPVAYERLDLRHLRALGPIRGGLPVGPPRSRDALAEVEEFLFRNVDLEGADCGCRGVRRRGRLRLGRLRRYSALRLPIALGDDAFAFVCACERDRTARQPSKTLHGDLPFSIEMSAPTRRRCWRPVSRCTAERPALAHEGSRRSLLRLDRVGISLLASVDLGVGRVLGAGLAVRGIHAVRISRLAGLELLVRWVGSAL